MTVNYVLSSCEEEIGRLHNCLKGGSERDEKQDCWSDGRV